MHRLLSVSCDSGVKSAVVRLSRGLGHALKPWAFEWLNVTALLVAQRRCKLHLLTIP